MRVKAVRSAYGGLMGFTRRINGYIIGYALQEDHVYNKIIGGLMVLEVMVVLDNTYSIIGSQMRAKKDTNVSFLKKKWTRSKQTFDCFF